MKIKLNKSKAETIPIKKAILRDLNFLEAFSKWKYVKAKSPKVFIKLQNYGWSHADVLAVEPNGKVEHFSMYNETEVFRVPLTSIEFL